MLIRVEELAAALDAQGNAVRERPKTNLKQKLAC